MNLQFPCRTLRRAEFAGVKASAMSEPPPSPKTSGDAAHPDSARRRRRVLNSARELVCRWPFTCFVTTLFLLGILAWIAVREVLTRFGIRASGWVEAASISITLMSFLAWKVLMWPGFREKKKPQSRPQSDSPRSSGMDDPLQG
jgi:hypothetical protein